MSVKLKSAGATASPTPSEHVVKSSLKEFSACDANGRLIVLRKPSTWEQFKLAGIMSPKDALNQALIFQWSMMQHVKQIGDDTDVFFTNERELKAIVDSLGDEGMETVQRIFMDHFLPNVEDRRENSKK